MKKTLIILGATAACAFSSTVQITTGGASGATITDNAGNDILAGGPAWAAFGTFDGRVLTAGESTGADLASAFTIESPVVALAPASFLFNTREATFNIDNVAKADLPTGSNISVIVWTGGNDSGPEAATEALVFQFAATYDNAGTPTSINYGTGANVDGVAAFGSLTQTAALFAIPEPSAALLAGLALVGGLVRRRR